MKATEIKDVLIKDFGKTEEELKDIKYPALLKMHTELKKAVVVSDVKDTGEADAKGTEKEDVVPEKPVEDTFKSMCGEAFDCKLNSDCFTVCKADNPEDFAKCEAHFKATATEAKKSASGKSKRGKNVYGHLNGSQAGLIDSALLVASEPLPLTKIAELAGAKSTRTRHHLKHLQSAWKVDIKITPDKGIYIGTLPQFKKFEKVKEHSAFV